MPFNPVRVLKKCIGWNMDVYGPFIPQINKSERPLSELNLNTMQNPVEAEPVI